MGSAATSQPASPTPALPTVPSQDGDNPTTADFEVIDNKSPSTDTASTCSSSTDDAAAPSCCTRQIHWRLEAAERRHLELEGKYWPLHTRSMNLLLRARRLGPYLDAVQTGRARPVPSVQDPEWDLMTLVQLRAALTGLEESLARVETEMFVLRHDANMAAAEVDALRGLERNALRKDCCGEEVDS